MKQHAAEQMRFILSHKGKVVSMECLSPLRHFVASSHMLPNIPLQPTVKKLRFLPSAELAR
jgi:hypothetical protein